MNQNLDNQPQTHRCNVCFDERADTFDVHGNQATENNQNDTGRLHFICIGCAEQLIRNTSTNVVARCVVCRDNINTDALVRAIATSLGPVVGEQSDRNMGRQLQRIINHDQARPNRLGAAIQLPVFNQNAFRAILPPANGNEANQNRLAPNQNNNNRQQNFDQILEDVFDILDND